MKTFIQCLALVLVLGFLHSCEDETEPNPPGNSINRIMPLGASRVEGLSPIFESFRYELWKNLSLSGRTFDFIGTKTDPAVFPTVQGKSFDPHHEGRGGYTSGQILEGINGWLQQAGTPDVVLFSSPGGNDALSNLPYDQTIAQINGVIDALQANNSKVIIVLEQLAPGHSGFMTAQQIQYFEQLKQDVLQIAATQTNDSSLVIAVDMFSGFTDQMLADDVHYNSLGAKFIADRYAAVLDTLLE